MDMTSPFGFVADIASWPFLQEPLWRWFLAFGAFLAIGWGWHGILELMH